MKIVLQTPSTLTLKLRPWFLWCFCTALSLPGLLTVALQPVGTLTCQKTVSQQGTCHFVTTSLVGATQQDWALQDMQKVEAVGNPQSTDRLTDRLTDRPYVRIQTKQGEVRLMSSYTASFNDEQQAAEQINTFLKNPEATRLDLREGQKLVNYSIASMSVFVGLAIAGLLGQVTTCSFDKGKAKVVVMRHGMLSNNTVERRLYDVIDVVVEESKTKLGQIFYRIAIVLQSGERLFIADYYGPLLDKDQMVDRIRAFLNLRSLGQTNP